VTVSEQCERCGKVTVTLNPRGCSDCGWAPNDAINWRERALAAEAKLKWYEDALRSPLGDLRDREVAAAALTTERDQLKAALSEALDWATGAGDKLRRHGLPIADEARIAELRKLVRDDP
jgi:ribosomal protein L37E